MQSLTKKHSIFAAVFALTLVCGVWTTPVAAFLYEVPVLEMDTIRGLSDEILLETYTEVLIDLEASTTFSRTAGFNKVEYDKFKNLIRYRVRLRAEIEKRKLEVPDIGSPCY